MFGDGIGRQQPQHAFAGLVLLGAGGFFLRLFLRGGRAEGAGEKDRQRETQKRSLSWHAALQNGYVPPGSR